MSHLKLCLNGDVCRMVNHDQMEKRIAKSPRWGNAPSCRRTIIVRMIGFFTQASRNLLMDRKSGMKWPPRFKFFSKLFFSSSLPSFFSSPCLKMLPSSPWSLSLFLPCSLSPLSLVPSGDQFRRPHPFLLTASEENEHYSPKQWASSDFPLNATIVPVICVSIDVIIA